MATTHWVATMPWHLAVHPVLRSHAAGVCHMQRDLKEGTQSALAFSAAGKPLAMSGQPALCTDLKDTYYLRQDRRSALQETPAVLLPPQRKPSTYTDASTTVACQLLSDCLFTLASKRNSNQNSCCPPKRSADMVAAHQTADSQQQYHP